MPHLFYSKPQISENIQVRTRAPDELVPQPLVTSVIAWILPGRRAAKSVSHTYECDILAQDIIHLVIVRSSRDRATSCRPSDPTPNSPIVTPDLIGVRISPEGRSVACASMIVALAISRALYLEISLISSIRSVSFCSRFGSPLVSPRFAYP